MGAIFVFLALTLDFWAIRRIFIKQQNKGNKVGKSVFYVWYSFLLVGL